MSDLRVLLYDTAVTIGTASLLYTGTVTATALTALLASSPARRRAARDVLEILLRRRDHRR
jgi:hypothetical protein